MDHVDGHILLAKAITYPRRNRDLRPQGCVYDIKTGAWLLEGQDILLVNTEDRTRPETKKSDIETGEDQKGS